MSFKRLSLSRVSELVFEYGLVSEDCPRNLDLNQL